MPREAGKVEEVAPVEVSAIPAPRRTCRAARRAGEKVSGAPAATSITSLATSTLSSWSLAVADRFFLPTILAVFGLQIKSATTSQMSKIVLEEEDEDEAEAVAAVTFGELDLSDYDSEADADYSPGEEETEDELEYCSEEEEVEEVCEVLAC